MLNVLVTDNLSTAGLKILDNYPDIHVDVQPTFEPTELKKVINNYQAIIIRSASKLNEDILKHANKLELIIRAGVGVDNIDLNAATEHGILVANTPHSNSVTTAEHTFALITSLVRNIAAASHTLKNGKWDKKRFVGVELCNKMLGLVGVGNIGSVVAKIAQGYGMHTITSDPFISHEHAESIGVKKVSLDELLKTSDIVTIHCPLNDHTRNIINAETIAKMKPSAFLINCARGGLVDEEALEQALKTKKLKGAALDVFVKEPVEQHPLFAYDNVVVTPHLGASTTEAQEGVSSEASALLIEYAKTKLASSALNAPLKLSAGSALQQTYIKLAEKIGSLHGQLLSGAPKKIVTECYGDDAQVLAEMLAVSSAKSILQHILSNERINFVNVKRHAQRRGIALKHSLIDTNSDSIAQSFNNLIRVVVVTEDEVGKTHQRVITGSVFGKNYFRIINVDDYQVDFVPEGYGLVITNNDKPGVIGQVGTLLAKHGVNISHMYLSLSPEQTEALSVYMVNTRVPANVIEHVIKLDNINSCRAVLL